MGWSDLKYGLLLGRLKMYFESRGLQKRYTFSTGVAGNGLQREPLGRAVKHEAQIASHQMDTEAETPILGPA